MKKSLALMVMATAGVYAAENTTAEMRPPLSLRYDDSILTLGASYNRVWYTPHNFSTFHGNLGGMQASYDYKPANAVYAGLHFAWKQGEMKQSSNKRELLDFDVHERIGYTFAGQDKRWMVSLFTGLGYRYLGHNLKQPGLSNLHFNYNEFYIPLGVTAEGSINSYFSMGLNFTWMPQVYTAVRIIPIDGANWVIKRKIANVRVEAPFTFTFPDNKRFFAQLMPVFEFWQDGKTTAVTQFGFALNVPGNNYLFCGAEFNLGYCF